MDKFVLLTDKNTYFVEYLLSSLVLSNSIEEAMVFNDFETASKFRMMLYKNCNLITSINTYII